MAFKDTIKSIILPSIPIAELSTPDTSGVNEANMLLTGTESSTSVRSSAGAESPFIKINSVDITEVDFMILDETGKIPRLKIIFTDMSGALGGANYPKNDPILSLYIRPQNIKFKPIRCDFLITSIKSELTSDKLSQFIMSGELFIPKIYNNVSKSYSKMTSKKALMEIATENNIGYAENEFDTKDSMTWVNPNTNSISFIDEISKHAYRDDDSFFDTFIDKYYHLNFIEVSEQLNPLSEVNKTYANATDTALVTLSREIEESYDSSTNSEASEILHLTNKDGFSTKPEYIHKFGLSGETGSILKNKGYRSQIYYYDHTLEGNKFTKFYVNPIKIKGYKTADTALVPDNESMRANLIKKWMNIDYGNTHREWYGAELINDHNNSELNKVKLVAETRGVNFQVIRGSGIPVLIYQDSAAKRTQDAYMSLENQDTTTEIDGVTLSLDEGLSGKYYVNGVKYIYDKDQDGVKYSTEFHLSRVNWIAEKNIL